MSSAPRQAVLITGAAKRVGADIARALAADGYDIALHYHHSREAAEALERELRESGVNAAVFPHDLSDVQGLQGMMERVCQRFSNLSVLIHNASIFERAHFLESDEKLFDAQMTINAKAPIFLTQAFARQVGRGHVITMLDSNISQHHGSHFMYLLSKKALAAFTQMAARDLAPDIQVNGICAGHMLPSAAEPENYGEQLATRLPMQELSTTEDVCRTIRFLLASPHITGQWIFTDSGQHLL